MSQQRRIWIAAIALVSLLLISVFTAPLNSDLRRGSTYTRSPDGYGAWFAYMQAQGTPVQRWQRPLEDLFKPLPSGPVTELPIESTEVAKTQGKFWILDFGFWIGTSPQPLMSSMASPMKPFYQKVSPSTYPLTLLRVSPNPSISLYPDEDWVKQGNVFVLLGVRSPVTAAPFTAVLNSDQGAVKIQTRRRNRDGVVGNGEALLADSYGAVVWEQQIGKGKVILVSTPHLAANAYQDEPGNFKFLADLLTRTGHPIWVDEYLHGYKDREAIEEESGKSWISYLADTPLLLLAVQAGVLLLVAIWGQNWRLGRAVAIAPEKTDNSRAYIEALGAVLNKAESSEFVLETVGKAEQLKIQQALGLGTTLVEPETLTQAWAQQTGRPAEDLAEILRPVARKRRISERDLLIWLGKVANIRRHLP